MVTVAMLRHAVRCKGCDEFPAQKAGGWKGSLAEPTRTPAQVQSTRRGTSYEYRLKGKSAIGPDDTIATRQYESKALRIRTGAAQDR